MKKRGDCSSVEAQVLEWGHEASSVGQIYLTGEDSLRWGCGVNAGGLDGDDKVAAVFEEVLCVDAHNAGLVWLCHICIAETILSAVFPKSTEHAIL